MARAQQLEHEPPLPPTVLRRSDTDATCFFDMHEKYRSLEDRMTTPGDYRTEPDQTGPDETPPRTGTSR
jgi:hypothetical protein